MAQYPLRKLGIFVQKVQKGEKISYLSGNKLDVAQSLEKMAQFVHSLVLLWTVLETLGQKGNVQDQRKAEIRPGERDQRHGAGDHPGR